MKLPEDIHFSEFLRILGKGPKSRRPLTEEEASQALLQILQGQVTDKQLGAFLLLMRANGETASELIGFVKTLRKYFKLTEISQPPSVDLDWAAYAGKWRYPPYYLLSIKLLVQNGFKICLHGDSGQFQTRQYAQDFLKMLNFVQASSVDDARVNIEKGCPTYLPLDCFAQPLKAILHLKEELGVRTVFNTAVKLLNPLNAPYAMQGIFHKGVENLHHSVAKSINIKRNVVFKGEGGEAEIRPDALTQCYVSLANRESLLMQPCPATIERQQRPKTWQPTDLLQLWEGTKQDIYGEAASINTAAIALSLIENIPYEMAIEKATQFWEAR